MPSTTAILSLLTLALTVSARTDYEGCTSSKTIAYGGASILWYVPGTGEVCAPLDCGGGRAPPKTTVPGCAAYSGTGTYSPSYIAIATDSGKSSYATAIGSWTSVASALSSSSSTVVASGLSSTLTSATVVPSTTAKATLSSVATAAAAAGTGVASGGLVIDTSVVANGTALSTSSRTPTAASASGSSASSTVTGAAGVVRIGRDAMVMFAGAVVGVALL